MSNDFSVKGLLDKNEIVERFYRKHLKILEDFQNNLPNNLSSNERDQLARVLFRRFIFLLFLQEKKFLDRNMNYLKEKLWSFKGTDFYGDFLEPLFFDCLGKRNSYNSETFGKIPFLNGGLFLPSSIERDESLIIAPEVFKQVFEFLSEWTWIADERKDVRKKTDITPEILGYIFEQSVNQKDLGAYYTPEYITQFLAKEAIHPTLLEKLGAKYKSIADLIEKGIPEELDVLIREILNLRVVDFAVGSGAFLLAAEKILVDIIEACLDRLHEIDPSRSPTAWLEPAFEKQSRRYCVKRAIITNCLFGVDIESEAIEICRLRLWLSMVSEAPLGPVEIEPLPNIEFNIVCGNTLFGITEQSISTQRIKKKHLLVETLQRLVESPFEDENKLISWLKEQNPLHWSFQFSESFARGGFDVLIGNPPYFKIKKGSQYRYTREFSEAMAGKGINAAALFVMRASKLLRRNGRLALVLPKMLSYAAGWINVRKALLDDFQLEQLIDCREVFSKVKLEQLLIIAQYREENFKGVLLGRIEQGRIVQSTYRSIKEFKERDMLYVELSPLAYAIRDKMERSGLLLGDEVKIKLGEGMGPKPFKTTRLRSDDIVVRKGDHIQRYRFRGALFLPRNDPLYTKKQRQINEHEIPHIQAQRIVAHIQDHIKVTAVLDTTGSWSLNTITNMFLRGGALWSLQELLGLLHSKAINFYAYKFIYNNAIRSIDLYEGYAKRIPLPPVPSGHAQRIHFKQTINDLQKLVEKDCKAEESSNFMRIQNLLDEMVFDMYGFTPEEKEHIRESFLLSAP